MDVHVFAQVILELMGRPNLSNARRAEALAPIVLETAERFGQDPILMALLIRNESNFEQAARGVHGEVGLGQVKPDGRGAHHCRKILLRIHRVRENLTCTAILMAEAKRRCGGSPENWISGYRGRCGPSGYSRRILARGTRWLPPGGSRG